MDNVFQEEQKKLAEIESKIDAIASRYERKANNLQAEILDFFCIDYEDRMRKRDLIQERLSVIRLSEQFRAYQPSPYFGRLDLDTEDAVESATYYIGKEGIADGSNVIVVDWRTPIGSCYYATNQKQFCVNGTNYQLSLRRALDVKNGVLVSYRTEYDGETVSLEGDVIDPFLLTVLKDKRRHNRLTDIIRTIQSNQNEIIRKPQTESFVVQGCAGSGKTMILLHRLSFLKFNNRNMPLGGVKIITPNKFFDAHINDLSIELGLTAIERFSVEEYYVSLIKRYSSKVTADAVVQSEKILSTELLKDIYSIQYLFDSIAHYHEYWAQVLSEICEEKLRTLFEKFHISYPNTANHTADTAFRLDQGLRQIISAIAEVEKKKKAIEARLASIDDEISKAKSEFDRASTNLDNIKKQTITRIDYEISVESSSIQKHKERIEELHKQRDELQEQYNKVEADIVKYTSILHLFSLSAKTYSNYDQFIQQNDAASELISAECHDLISAIVDVEKIYKKTPNYNFGKRNSLKKQISEKKQRFNEAVSEFISTYLKDAEATLNTFHATINSLNDKIVSINEAIGSFGKEVHSHETKLSALRECTILFTSTEAPDTQTGLLLATHKECASILSSYEEQRNICNRISRKLSSLMHTRQGLEREQQDFAKTSFLPEEIAFIPDCSKALKQLQFNEISRNVMFRDLLAEYKAHNQKYQKTNYRHKLYLKLLYCSLYFTSPINTDSFLNIDEAQDISIAEYHLLRMVLGDKCVFNLYGDINQSVYSYKGITDWEEISDITGGNIYVLNENYRNTLQITNFCNEEFGAEVYPIGVSGEPVVELNTSDAIKWILDVKTQNPQYRVAILHRHGVKAIQDLLCILLKDQDVSWYAVDEKKLSVISVETAKGLEFEAVVAIVDQMSPNEKYISYTRALDRLSVVRDKFASGLVSDDENEEIDDEFLAPAETTPEISEEQKSAYKALINVLFAVLCKKRITSSQPNSSDDSLSQARYALIGQLSNLFQAKMSAPGKLSKVPTEIQLSEKEYLLIDEFNSILKDRFGSIHKLTSIHQQIICSLYRGNKVAYNAPSGSMKSVILHLLAMKEHQTSGKQTIVTAESHLQENALVLADRLGVKGGIITGSMAGFLADFKKDKYDVIFVPYDFFKQYENIAPFIDYFVDKVCYWGLDHPASEKALWAQLNNCCIGLKATMYLMSKDGFSGLDLNSFNIYDIQSDINQDIIKKQTLFAPEDRLEWLLNNLEELYGQGLIYCDNEATCKLLSKQLRKNRIMAEAYIDVTNPEKRERINYLTNSFSSGRLPVLITTHEVGKNLSNPRIRFIIHYDIPADEHLHRLHVSQIGHLVENPVVYDLYVL